MTAGQILFNVVFYFFALLTILSASVVAFSRNILHSAFALLFTFWGVAGLYIFSDAQFLAAAQVLIYVGGILVLILFAIMLTHRNPREDSGQESNQSSSVILASGITVLVYAALLAVYLPVDWSGKAAPYGTMTTEMLGTALIKNYIVPFEAVSVLLLAALLGAAYLARRK